MTLGKQLWVGHETLSEEHIQPVGEGHLGVKGKVDCGLALT
jgi:hypothetical protein